MLSPKEQLATLKTLPRKGWVRRGVCSPETVAEHTVECVMIAHAIAERLGVDRRRVCDILKVHDWGESDPRVGDITPHDGISREEKQELEYAAMRRLTGRMRNGDAVMALWLEFEEQRTAEALVARQIDKFQMALQAMRYHEEQGLDPREFLQDASSSIVHPLLSDFIARFQAALLP